MEHRLSKPKRDRDGFHLRSVSQGRTQSLMHSDRDQRDVVRGKHRHGQILSRNQGDDLGHASRSESRSTQFRDGDVNEYHGALLGSDDHLGGK